MCEREGEREREKERERGSREIERDVEGSHVELQTAEALCLPNVKIYNISIREFGFTFLLFF